MLADYQSLIDLNRAEQNEPYAMHGIKKTGYKSLRIGLRPGRGS